MSALKRAYAKLIRHFKPEHHPEEFQRIHEAYQSAKRWQSSWYDFDEESFSLPNTVQLTRDELATAQSQSAKTADWEDAWEQAKKGELPLGYHALKQAADREPGQEEICLRLFWLLKLSPLLDDRPAVSWLVRGMRVRGLRGQMFQLYLQELEHSPLAALEAGTEDLLALPESPDRLGQLLTARARAACRVGKLSKAEAELERMRNPLISESPAAWVRVLSAVLDEVAWLEWPSSSELYAKWVKELKTFEDMHHGMEYVFDRLELLSELRKRISPLAKHKRILGLVRLAIRSWNTANDIENRRAFFEEFTRWASAPAESLKRLDQAHKAAPQVVGQIREATRRWGYGLDSTGRLPMGDPALLNLFKQWATDSYSSIRNSIAAFCIEEWVAPGEIVKILIEDQGLRLAAYRSRSKLAEHLHDDLPLKVLVDGIRAAHQVGRT